jgi:hypothetical protein
MQPSPVKNPGGDCFACALAAVLRHISGEEVDFERVFHYWEQESDSGKSLVNNTWMGLQSALINALRDGFDIEYVNDFVAPIWKPEVFGHAFWLSIPESQWARRLESWLSAGWVAMAVIDYDGRGPVLPNGKFNCDNHFIAIDGFCSEYVPHETVAGAKIHVNSAHVVCSVRGAYWITIDDLLTKHGAAALWLVRKRDRA